MAKVDHKLSEKSQLSGRFLYDDTNNPTGGATVGFPGYNTSQVNGYRNFLVSETHIFAPTVTNEASRGLAVTGAYTWSKLIDNGSHIFGVGGTNAQAMSAVPSIFGGLGRGQHWRQSGSPGLQSERTQK